MNFQNIPDRASSTTTNTLVAVEAVIQLLLPLVAVVAVVQLLLPLVAAVAVVQLLLPLHQDG